MRLATSCLCALALLGCGSSEPPAARPAAQGAARSLRIAVVQTESEDGAVARNLARAAALVERAASAGAVLVALPEFMPGGYSLGYDAWDAAEPQGGATERWLEELAKRLGIHVGTSYLEASGEDFYNTFALADPSGAIAGRVRKSVTADLEGRLFRAEAGPHVIATSLGRIGIGICQESYRCSLAAQLHEEDADLVLLPHSFPDLSESGGLGSPPGRFVAQWYARQLGVPVAMINKVGPWQLSLPDIPQMRGRFPGLSAITDASGAVRSELGADADFAVSEVSLDPALHRAPQYACTGAFVDDLALGGPLQRAITRLFIRAAGWLDLDTVEKRAQRAYAENPERARRARALSAAAPHDPSGP
jgi:N-carbamoylputrescine amidase